MKVLINIVHDCVIFNAFQVIQKKIEITKTFVTMF
jgi:hypothetical protein